MSKHAIEAFADTLEKEMQRFDVKVSVIEPGNYNSEIGKTARSRRSELSAAQEQSPYADYYQGHFEGTGDRSQYKDPGEVSAAIEHALFDANPKHRCKIYCAGDRRP